MGRFGYTTKHKSLKDRYRKNNRGLFGWKYQPGCADVRKSFQEFEANDASRPTVLVQCIRAALPIMVFRSLTFRVIHVSGAFLKSEPVERETYSKPPHGSEIDIQSMWNLTEPPYGLSTKCKDRYVILMDYLLDRGVKVAS